MPKLTLTHACDGLDSVGCPNWHWHMSVMDWTLLVVQTDTDMSVMDWTPLVVQSSDKFMLWTSWLLGENDTSSHVCDGLDSVGCPEQWQVYVIDVMTLGWTGHMSVMDWTHLGWGETCLCDRLSSISLVHLNTADLSVACGQWDVFTTAVACGQWLVFTTAACCLWAVSYVHNCCLWAVTCVHDYCCLWAVTYVHNCCLLPMGSDVFTVVACGQ